MPQLEPRSQKRDLEPPAQICGSHPSRKKRGMDGAHAIMEDA